MDSDDALFHIHGVKFENVHDTSCFHDELSGCEDSKNLNYVLKIIMVLVKIITATLTSIVRTKLSGELNH